MCDCPLKMKPVDQHPPVDAHQDLLHQTLRLLGLKIGRMNIVGTGQEPRTIDVPHVVGNIGRVVKPRPAEPTLPEVLEPSRDAKHRVQPGVERGHPVGQVGYTVTVCPIDTLSPAKQVVVDICGDHDQLIHKTDKQRLVLPGPDVVHRFLKKIVTHAVRNDRNLGTTLLAARLHGAHLVSVQVVVQRRENVSQLVGRAARV